jgi:hypothetical protein
VILFANQTTHITNPPIHLMKTAIHLVLAVTVALLLGACTKNEYHTHTTILPEPSPTPRAQARPAPVRKAPAGIATNQGDGFEAMRKPTSYSNP